MNNLKHNHEGTERQKQGISSFSRINAELVFKTLNLKQGDFLIDIGCGAGDYAIKAAKIVGNKGIVYALDQWEEIALSLDKKASEQGLKNIKTLTSNIINKLPLSDNIADVCLFVTVLHGVDLDIYGENLFNEIHRILKPSGRLVIVEVKKEETPFGPPMEIRLSVDDIRNYLSPYPFKDFSVTDLDSCYMIEFETVK